MIIIELYTFGTFQIDVFITTNLFRVVIVRYYLNFKRIEEFLTTSLIFASRIISLHFQKLYFQSCPIYLQFRTTTCLLAGSLDSNGDGVSLLCPLEPGVV